MEIIDQFKVKFIEESTDNINDLEEALLLLESDKENKELIERSFRAMHSIKGGGAMFGFNKLSEFTHHLESIYDSVRQGSIPISTELITLTFSAIDQIKLLLKVGDNLSQEDLVNFDSSVKMFEHFIEKQNNTSTITDENDDYEEVEEVENITEPKNNNNEKTVLISFVPNPDLLENGTNPFFLLDDLNNMGRAITLAFSNKIPNFVDLKPVVSYINWQILICTEHTINELKDVFIFVEDDCELHIDTIADTCIIDHPEVKKIIQNAQNTGVLMTIKELKNCTLSATQTKTQGKKKLAVDSGKDHKISSIRVSSNKIDELVTLVSELVITQSQLTLYAENNNDTTIAAISENIQKLSRQLRDNAFNISLIPLQSELMRFQRLVRDLSKEQDKDIDFTIEGSEIELDKTIIENLTDPLLHILRNSVDHGIETKKQRIAAGKSPKGNIIFKAFNSGANVVIEISDDGKGIDPEEIRSKAVYQGLIDQDAKLEKEEILELLFTSGFSTRTIVTDLSGRGVGLDVVRRKLESIRGKATIDSEKGKGTIITIRLPLTLSIIDGLLIKVANNHYVLPISAIKTIYSAELLREDNSFNHVITIDDEQVPYIDLREIFQENDRTEEDHSQLILIKVEERLLGIIADDVIGEYQTVVKPLGRYLEKQGYISGASILGDGTIALVIDTSRLFNARKIKKEISQEKSTSLKKLLNA
ncbi:MAG: chemotaxis protein CheA [Marinilabiliaceae bacterium]|nr:chemotaxis protein CheA [Marinilabiliaceae bacterium]